MRGKYLFLLFFVLVPCVTWGACLEYNNDPDECTAQPGCQYLPETTLTGPECTECSENDYCPQDAICSDGIPSSDGSCQCPTPFTFSTRGTASIDDCYAPCAPDSDDGTENCGLRYIDYNAPAVVCETNNGLEENSAYHIEPLGVDTYGCYKNNRECNRFSAIDHDGNGLIADNMQGEAVWDANHNNGAGGYDIRACRYKSTNEQSASKHCTRTVFYSPRNDDKHVSNAQEAIQFYTGGNYVTNADYYYCTSCENGPYYPTNTNATNCANPTDHENSGTTYYMACSCEQIPQGYYQINQWNYNQDPLNTYYTACPAGKTTLNQLNGVTVGGTSSDDCTYTPDTKFCDANGCFKITDADSWNWSD